MNKNDKLIDDIISMLDKSIEQGTGHININVKKGKAEVEKLTPGDEELIKTVETLNCTDCSR